MTDQPKVEAVDINKVREEFLAKSKETGTCTSFRTFSLGANGTVMVMCGLPVDHEKPTGKSDDDGNPEPVLFKFHQASRKEDDDALVVFQWPAV